MLLTMDRKTFNFTNRKRRSVRLFVVFVAVFGVTGLSGLISGLSVDTDYRIKEDHEVHHRVKRGAPSALTGEITGVFQGIYPFFTTRKGTCAEGDVFTVVSLSFCTNDALGHGYPCLIPDIYPLLLTPGGHHWRHGTYPLLLTCGGHHWRPIQTCSL